MAMVSNITNKIASDNYDAGYKDGFKNGYEQAGEEITARINDVIETCRSTYEGTPFAENLNTIILLLNGALEPHEEKPSWDYMIRRMDGDPEIWQRNRA